MAVTMRLRWAFTALVLVVSAVGCGGGGNGGNGPDAAVVDECALACGHPDQCCDLTAGRFCIHVENDILNCGGCGIVCDAKSANGCGGFECKCGLGPACTNGKTCVSDVVGCRDLDSDPQNCGTTGHACGPEETCVGGLCTCAGATCGTDQTCCNDECVDLKTNADHCGECYNKCSDPDENTCSNGNCGCPGGGSCPAPAPNSVGKCCGTGCSNICTDEMNCGECGHVCPVGSTCNLGGCSGEQNPDPEQCVVITP